MDRLPINANKTELNSGRRYDNHAKFRTSRGQISALLPLSFIWLFAGKLRQMLAKTEIADLPVIVSVYPYRQTGREPSMPLRVLKEQGYAPCILTRGYKGYRRPRVC